MPEPTDIVLSFLRGVDNRSEETKLPRGFARGADNVDIGADGTVKTREGYALYAALTGAHSLWIDAGSPFFFVADATTLYAMDTTGALTSVDSVTGTDISYVQVDGLTYWSDNVKTGAITASAQAVSWGVETPPPSFTLAASSAGGMHAGRYGVTMTFARGEESGAPAPVYVDVPEGGGITVSGIPVPSDAAVAAVRIYRTSTNSPDLLYADTVAPGTTTFSLGDGVLGRPLTTLFGDKFPPAAFLLATHGRIFGAYSSRQLIWSRALYYGQIKATDNFIEYPDPITMIAAPASAGFVLYIATTKKTYLLVGDSIDAVHQVAVCNCGAVPGSMAMLPAEELELEGVNYDVPVWVGTDGVPYAGTAQGVLPLSKNFAYPIYARAAAAYLEVRGEGRYIVSGKGGKPSGFMATDSAEATVYNNGGGA